MHTCTFHALDYLNIKTLIAQNVNSELGSRNGLQGVEADDPTEEKQGTLTARKRPGIPGEGQSSAEARSTSKPFV